MHNLNPTLYAFIRLMRFDKPIGTLLLLWPTLAALWLAAQSTPSLKLLVIFTLGVIIMRAAGCVVNDMVDRKFDKHVARTRSRPLVTHELSLAQALSALGILLFFALGLLLFLNTLTFWLAFIGVALTIFYPFAKRITRFPQVVLGAAFNWGVILAFSATQNTVPLLAWIFYAITLIWTVAYDTLYAMADKEDDQHLPIHSTALTFGRYDWAITVLLYGVFFVSLIGLGLYLHFSLLFYGCVSLALFYIGFYLYRARSHSPQDALRAFLANHVVGLGMWLGIVVGS